MLRTALRTQLRPARTHSRSFVSTVLLTKAWENETINELRKEARKRGLSSSGNKATLITRLRTDEEKTLSHPPSVSPQASKQVRHASTTEVPGVPSEQAPPPLPNTYPKDFLDIKLPDVSQPDPEPPIQIPFLPDLWESSRIKAESAPKAAEADPDAPKMIAVAGSATHHGGGPTHSLSSINEADSVLAHEASKPGPTGFWGGLIEDLNLPTSLPRAAKSAEATLFDIAEKTETSGAHEKSYSRTLDRDEVRGLWVLLGLVAGSWAAAGYFKAPSAFAAKAEEVTQEAEAKTAGH